MAPEVLRAWRKKPQRKLEEIPAIDVSAQIKIGAVQAAYGARQLPVSKQQIYASSVLYERVQGSAWPHIVELPPLKTSQRSRLLNETKEGYEFDEENGRISHESLPYLWPFFAGSAIATLDSRLRSGAGIYETLDGWERPFASPAFATH